jgi:hypothetical protein
MIVDTTVVLLFQLTDQVLVFRVQLADVYIVCRDAATQLRYAFF